MITLPEKCCGTCHWMAAGGKRKPRRVRWWEPGAGFRSDPNAPFEPAPGKGVCTEPGVTKYNDLGTPTLFYVTDMTCCSMWSPPRQSPPQEWAR